ncbi:protein phosphatase 2C domain-containing protein [uncultured Thiohalocapsa sp.]|uniref:protein phosphatase 2C domain-containing protein n=1 Tax=uncultured Thiohalocapsa sp. TaxID=768990 RepID=UPI0025E8E89A|nr:protein phosphatase 2C domain-containing protein [uncultured Thiohalocapsa sp.]
MDIRPGNAWWQGRRQEQQDAFGFAGFDDAVLRTHGGVLMVLADGMGGMSGGREASRIAVEHFMAAYRQKPAQEDIPTALERALAAANRAVYELALTREGEGEVGTTLVAAVVHEGSVHWISVGDSRLYLYQAAGDTLTLCTEDHTQGNELLEQVARGALTRAAAEADPDFHALVSFLGLRDIPKVDRSVRPLPLTAGDRLLLVSDGVYGTLAESDIGMLLRDEAQHAAEALIRAVKERAGAGQDNATATVIAFGDALPPTRIAHAPALSAGTRSTAAPAPTQRRRRIGKGLTRGIAALALLLIGIGIGLYLSMPLAPPPEPAVGEVDEMEAGTVPEPPTETFYLDPPDEDEAGEAPQQAEGPPAEEEAGTDSQSRDAQPEGPQSPPREALDTPPGALTLDQPEHDQQTPSERESTAAPRGQPSHRRDVPVTPAAQAPEPPKPPAQSVDGKTESGGPPVEDRRPLEQSDQPKTESAAESERKRRWWWPFGGRNSDKEGNPPDDGSGSDSDAADSPWMENF